MCDRKHNKGITCDILHDFAVREPPINSHENYIEIEQETENKFYAFTFALSHGKIVEML